MMVSCKCFIMYMYIHKYTLKLIFIHFPLQLAPHTSHSLVSFFLSDCKYIDIGMGSLAQYVGWLEWEKGVNVGGWDGRLNASHLTPGSKTLAKVEEWKCISINGGGRIKDLATSEPYRLHKLQPFVTAAFRVPRSDMDAMLGKYAGGMEGGKETTSPSDISSLLSPPDTGMLYCGGGLVGITGLPFHIEGPFLHDLINRCVALPASTLTHKKGVESFDSFTVTGMHVVVFCCLYIFIPFQTHPHILVLTQPS